MQINHTIAREAARFAGLITAAIAAIIIGVLITALLWNAAPALGIISALAIGWAIITAITYCAIIDTHRNK